MNSPRNMRPPGRNAPCACGSGKKAKRCHPGMPKHDCARESGVVYVPGICKDAAEVVRRFPRKSCPVCNTICYTSFEHFLAGDW